MFDSGEMPVMKVLIHSCILLIISTGTLEQNDTVISFRDKFTFIKDTV